jgi:hypothetical protein
MLPALRRRRPQPVALEGGDVDVPQPNIESASNSDMPHIMPALAGPYFSAWVSHHHEYSWAPNHALFLLDISSHQNYLI